MKLNLSDAPTFRPSPEEFKDPFAYISDIRGQAESYGICKVVPPAGWQPPFAIDRQNFRFRTRVQAVNELQLTVDQAAAAESFSRDYQAWLRSQGKPVKRPPQLAGEELDLAKLFRVVSRRGGYDQVCEDRLWKEVARIMQIDDRSTNVVSALRATYQKHLQPFEVQCKTRLDPGAYVPSKGKRPACDRPAHSAEGASEAADDAAEAAEILGSLMNLEHTAILGQPPRKRMKMDAPDHTLQPGSAGIRVPDNIFTLNCELCKGGHHEAKIILCDQCDRGCHLFCLNPPLEEVPEGHWVCPLCIEADAEGGAFRQGEEYSMSEFEQIAADFQREYFKDHDASTGPVPWQAIEEAFWDIVEEGEEDIEVLYGADLDSTIFGSAFPTRNGRMSESEYADAPWNLNNIPRLPGENGNLLRHVEENIPGVMVPWVYVGMLFSSFAWHIEDHMFYSINYNHWGAPKRWYGVPSAAAPAFEDAFKSALPDKFEQHPDLLFHLTAMLSPRTLLDHNVPVFAVLQEPGEFVITFPRAYHGGFNMGFNCAEAVNFAPADWLRFGKLSQERYRAFRKPSLLCHEWLLFKAAAEEKSVQTSFYVDLDMQRLIQEELEWRCRLWQEGCQRSRQVTQEVGLDEGDTEDAECVICHAYVRESAAECDCCPRRHTCLRHAANLCECPPAKWRLAFRHSIAQLEELAASVRSRIPEGYAASMKEAAALPEAASPAKEPVSEVAVPKAEEKQAADDALPDSARPSTPKSKKRKKERAAPLVRKTRAQLKEEAEQIARLTAAEPEPDPEPEPEFDLADDPDAMEALDAFSALAELADHAEKEAGAMEAEAEAEAQANGSAELDAADVKMEEALPNGHEAEGRPLPNGHLGGTAGEAAAAAAHLAVNVEELLNDLRAARDDFVARAKRLLEQGGAKVTELETLIAQAEQFAWGPADVTADIGDLHSCLKDAKQWVAQVNMLGKTKGTIEELEPVVAWDPPPCYVSHFSKLREGYAAALVWQQEASEMLTKMEGVVELKALESLVSQASKLPVSLPDAKILRERVAVGRKLVEAITAALPARRVEAVATTPLGQRSRRAKGEPALQRSSSAATPKASEYEVITLERLKEVQAQAEAAKVKVAEADALDAAVQLMEDFQERCRALMRTKPTLGELVKLDADAEELPGIIPEMDALNRLLIKAQDWLASMGAVSRQRVPLKKMREVLHAGQRLGVDIPEVEQLRLDIRRREWEDQAKKALAGKQTLFLLQEMLAEADSKGAAETPLADTLRMRIEAAEKWEQRAATFLADAENEKQQLDTLDELAREGNAMGVKLSELPQINAALSAATAWAKSAASAAAPPSLRATHAKRPALALVEKLLEQYENITVELWEAAALREKHMAASTWAEEAQRVLDRERPFRDEDASMLEELADRGQAIGLNIPQLASLRDCLAALHWATRARALLASTELDPRPAAPAQAAAQPQAAPAEQGAAPAASLAELQAVTGGRQPDSSALAQESALAPLQLRLDMSGSRPGEADQVPSTPRQPIEVHVPGAPKMGNKTSSALALEQAPSAALQDDCMARAANAAAAAAIGLDDAGLNDLTTSEQLEPASMPAEAEILGALHGLPDSGQPGVDLKAMAEPTDSKAAELQQGASTAPSTPMPEGLPSSASAAAGASAAAAADAPSAGDGPMHDASASAEALPAPEQKPELHAGQLQAEQPPEQMTQAYPAALQDVQPPEQLTQAYAAPMEVDGAITAQHAEQGGAAPEAPSAAPILRPDGKPLIAGSAIFTKVSPMKGKVTIEDYMSEFEGASAAPAGAPDPGLAAQLSGPWMKALLADEEEAAGTDLFSQLTPTPPTPQPASAPAVDASAQQENLFAFIDSVMQQAVPPSADARAEAAVASASAPQDNPQSTAAAHEGRADVKTEYGILAERSESEERRAAEEEAAHEDTRRRGLQPTLGQVSSMAAEAQDLPVDQELRARLEGLVAAAEDWEARASGVLNPKKGPGAAKPATVAEVEELLKEGKRLGLQLKGLPRLISMMAQARSFNMRARRALKREKPLYADVSALADAAADLPVTSPLTEGIMDIVNAADDWLELARKTVAKRNSGQKLGKCLQWMLSSLDRALEQFTLRLQDEKRLYVRSQEARVHSPPEAEEKLDEPPRPPPPGGALAKRKRSATSKSLDVETGGIEIFNENENTLYCVCQQPYNVDTSMIECDSCHEWYHVKCVGLSQGAARSLKKYACPICTALKGHPGDLDAAIGRTKRTRRVEKRQLVALVTDGNALPCIMPDIEVIAKIVTYYERWQNAVDMTIRAHEQAVCIPENPRAAQLPIHTRPAGRARISLLSQLGKSSLAMEVDAGVLGGRVLAALRAERWRTAAESAMRNPSRATVDHMCKLVKEAEECSVALNCDIIGATLNYRAAAAKDWLSRSRQAINDLFKHDKREGELEVFLKQAGLLAKEADRLQCNVTRDLEKLKDAMKLYCLCKLPHDGERPMLQCDSCRDWFHWDCVGLTPPGDDEDDEEVAPADFQCPSCCVKAQRPYPQLHKLPHHSRTALEQVFGAARLANPCPERPQPAQAPIEAPTAAMHGNMNGNGYTLSLPAPNGAPAGLPQMLSGLQYNGGAISYQLPGGVTLNSDGSLHPQAQILLAALAAQGHSAALQQHLQQQPMLTLNMGPHMAAHLAQLPASQPSPAEQQQHMQQHLHHQQQQQQQQQRTTVIQLAPASSNQQPSEQQPAPESA